MARIARSNQDERSRSLLARLVDFIRQTMVLVVLLGALGVIAWMYVHSRADGEICACIQRNLLAFYEGQGLDVSVYSARRVEGKGIELRGLKVLQFGEERPIAEIDEVFIACTTDLSDLVTQKVDARHIELRRPKLRATRDRNGDWSFVKLFRRKNDGMKPPTISIENGRIEVRDLQHDTSRSFNINEINLDLTPAPEIRHKLLTWNEDTIASAPPTTPVPESNSDVLRVRGRMTGDHFRRVDVDAYVNLANGTWSVKGAIDELAISSTLVESLPGEVAAYVAAMPNLRATARLGFQAEQTSPDVAPRFSFNGELTEGRYEDTRLPAPLRDIYARLSADNRELKIDEFTAKCGQASLQASVHSLGYAEDSPITIRGIARNFELNDHVVSLLPEAAQTAWEKFSPRGTVDADVTLSFDGQRWRPEVKVECLDVSFAYQKFPFRMQNTHGILRLKEGLLTSENLQAIANEKTIRVNLEVRDPGENFFGWVELASEGAVPLDEKLLIALETDQERIVRSLRPRGEITVWGRFGRRRASDPLERRLEIGLRDCHINYVGFPYPFDHVRGTLAMTNGQWEVRDMHGQNDSTLVECKGSWHTDHAHGCKLNLTFEATDVALDEELKSALKPSMQRFWASLRPRGSIDHLIAVAQFESATKNLSIDVRANKFPPKQSVEGRSITLVPTWFPYQWDNVVGEVRFRDGEVEMKDLRATHGRTALQLSGTGKVSPEGQWSANISKLITDRMTMDQELMAALPTRFGEMAARLNFSGPVGAQGTMEMSGSGKPNELPRANWNLTLDVEGGNVRVGLPLQQIRGSVQLVGGADETSFYSQGELDIHSVICRDIQLTQIKGPIRIEPTRVVFGDFWSGQKTLNRPPRQVTCRLFGGSTSADAVVLFGNDVQFDVLASLNDADMALISRDALPKKRDISGRAFATVRLQGTDKGAHTFRGGGQMQLRDADIYDVPIASGVFNRLKVRRPDVAGFTSCDTDFRIQGDRVYFNRLDLIGNAITLKGTGEMGLDRQINLNFYTMVGREEMRVPLLTPVLAEASRQLFEVQVHGTMDDPRIEQRAVPVISEALRQMFPELAERANARAEGRGVLQRITSPRK